MPSENKMDVHFSSASDEWETPLSLFTEYNIIYKFQLDAAATRENALCNFFFTKEDSALTKDWSGYDSVWLNPPYGRLVGHFVKKAYEDKSKQWKMAFRAGKEVVEPAREFVQNWVQEIK